MISVSPVCREAGDHEPRAGANIGRLDRRARKLLSTPLITAALLSIVTFDVGAHARELVDVRKARVENRLFDDAGAGTVQRKPTICGCRSVGNPGYGAVRMSVPPVIAVGLHANPVVAGRRHDAALHELIESASCRCSGRQPVTVTSPRVTAPASSSVPVTMRSAMISYSTPCSSSTPSTRTVSVPLAGDLRAHRDQEVREVDDFGFHRRRCASSSCRRPTPRRACAFFVAPTLGMRNSIVGAVSTRRPCDCGDQDSRGRCALRSRARRKPARACRSRAFRARSRREAALRRGRSVRAAVPTMSNEAASLRTSAYGARYDRNVARIDRHRVVAFVANPRAESFQQRPHHRHVGDARHAMERYGPFGKQCGGHDRQRGVLRAVRRDRALQAARRPEPGASFRADRAYLRFTVRVRGRGVAYLVAGESQLGAREIDDGLLARVERGIRAGSLLPLDGLVASSLARPRDDDVLERGPPRPPARSRGPGAPA